MTNVELYSHGKSLFVRVMSSLDDHSLASPCRACPGWSIRDVLAHHVRVVRAKLEGAIPAAALIAVLDPDPGVRRKASEERDQWTSAGVAADRALGINELLAEWNELESRLPEDCAIVCVDLIVHLFDVEETVGDADDRHSPVVLGALKTLHWVLTRRLQAQGFDPVTLVCTDTGVVLEGGPAGGTVRGSEYDLMRCIAGRRDQAETNELLDWTDTPAVAQKLFNVYGWAEESIHRSPIA
jgi:uncharacterized protein (TIGR03083 family)